jgi:hypothetical protein
LLLYVSAGFKMNSSEDARVRLRAAAWLCQEAEKREKLEAGRLLDQGDEFQRDKIISELRDLYRKELPAEPPLVEEVDDVTAAEEGAVGEVGLEPPCESSPQEEETLLDPAAADGGEKGRA